MASELFIGSSLPDCLPDEPQRKRLPALALVFALPMRALALLLLAVLSVMAAPLYLLGSAIWGRPPNVARLPQVVRYLAWTWTVRPPSPGLPTLRRCWLTLSIVRKVLVIPLWGSAWLLDEALYGRALDATPVTAPLIEISAGRSGSTQIARYLEDDPQLAAPGLLQYLFPYLWLWRLVPKTLGRILTAEKVRRKVESILAPEFVQRHEMDPFRTDSFEGVLLLTHLNGLSFFLGPEVMSQEIHFSRIASHNQALWEEDFIELTDRIGRKTLLDAGPGPDGPRRFFFKGHFLLAGPALERRYPDARFLTMIREPASRLRSCINFLRVNPMDPALGPVPWPWLSRIVVDIEREYCLIEKEWFSREGGARRCVVRFSEYRVDLEAAMRKVYSECLDVEVLPPHVPRVHTPRKRTEYLVDRSLENLGIDSEGLSEELADYIEWCRPRHE